MSQTVSVSASSPSATLVQTLMCRVFEAMYFYSPQYCGSGRLEQPVTGASVAFAGSVSGELRVAANIRLVRQLTADFLGIDAAEVSEAHLDATVRELANVACCSMVSACMPGEDFHFSVPRGIEDGDLQQNLTHCFSGDQGTPQVGLDFRLIHPS